MGLFECLFHLSKEICYEVKQRRVLYRDVNIEKKYEVATEQERNPPIIVQ